MKKVLFFVLHLFVFISLHAQNITDVRIYVPAVTGEGRFGDSNYFYQQITYEVVSLQHSIVRSQSVSNYTLKGFITPEPVYGSMNYVFFLELINSKTNDVIAQQNFVYYTLDVSVVRLISSIVGNMLSGIPNVFASEDIRDKYIFIDGKILWVPRLYSSQNDSIFWMNIGLEFSFEYHFLKFMAINTGIHFTQDWIIVSNSNDQIEEYRDLILDIPVIMKFIFKPGSFMLEPYYGISINASLMRITQPSLLSWLIGFQFGVKAGPGLIVFDPRFTCDIFNSSYDTLIYNRYTIQIGAGYKVGFLPRKKKDNY